MKWRKLKNPPYPKGDAVVAGWLEDHEGRMHYCVGTDRPEDADKTGDYK